MAACLVAACLVDAAYPSLRTTALTTFKSTAGRVSAGSCINYFQKFSFSMCHLSFAAGLYTATALPLHQR